MKRWKKLYETSDFEDGIDVDQMVKGVLDAILNFGTAADVEDDDEDSYKDKGYKVWDIDPKLKDEIEKLCEKFAIEANKVSKVKSSYMLGVHFFIESSEADNSFRENKENYTDYYELVDITEKLKHNVLTVGSFFINKNDKITTAM